MRLRIPAVLLALSAMATGCISEATVDSNESVGAVSQDFNPASSIVPLPNILTLNQSTGRNNFPPQCGESAGAAGIRGGILNQLDGAGTWLPPLTVTFTEEVNIDDVTEVASHIALRKLLGTSLGAAVPVQVRRYQTVRYDDAYPVCGSSNVVEGLTLIPTAPLDDNGFYVVTITRGLVSKTSGETFEPSGTFLFTTGAESPVVFADTNGNGVIEGNEFTRNTTPLNAYDRTDANGDGVADTVAQLQGLAQLWQANNQFLPLVNAAGTPSSDLLIAWMFKTQTEEAQLSTTATRGPASHVDEGDFNINPGSPVEGLAVEPTLEDPLIGGANFCQTPGFDCSKVQAFYGITTPATFSAQNYQVPVRNPGVLTATVAGPWADPIDPPQAGAPNTLPYAAFLPAGTVPDGGWPVVIFGHGLSSSRTALVAIGVQLAMKGLASIAIDWPQSGSRAVQIYPGNTACLTSGDNPASPSPTRSPACFQPILTADLAATRDNVRQGVVDVLRLVEVLKQCDANPAVCGNFDVNATRIGYMGQSLGGIIGSIPTAMSADIKASVLNVPGISWLTILENTDTQTIKCPLIDALIRQGAIEGVLWDNGNNQTDATCLQLDPTTQAVAVSLTGAYQTFAAAARWVLDPADGINFMDRLGARVQGGQLKVLVQQVAGDIVVPNEATALLGRFLGFTTGPTTAATPTSGTPDPSPEVDANPPALWLNYVSQDGVAVYQHASLLAPAAGTPGFLGTAQMQADALTFLQNNL